jgi:quercetin dioxygenase-like cupin family protein
MTTPNLAHAHIGSFSMTISLALRLGSLRGLVRRVGAMTPISGFAYRIGALLNPSGMTIKTVRRAMRAASVPLVAAIALGASPAIAQNREQVRVVFERALPNVEGKRIVAVMVSYPPGGKSLAHRHAASAFIYAYVLSGAIRSQVGSDLAKVYHAGEGFYEMPGSHHRISENASEMESASLLAVFVVDSKDDPLTTPDKAPGSQ